MPADMPIFVPAFAKINLTLAVLGRRSDGYHELASVMQTVSLYDTLRIAPRAEGALTCATDLPELDIPDNLALRAAHLAQATTTTLIGADIELHKEIPVQAGLGGGSSDAAAVLAALNALWGLRLPTARLEQVSATLGSDVPFFVRGGTALVSGRGERVHALPDAEALWFVLVQPPVRVATRAAFQALAPADVAASDPHTPAIVAAIRRGQPLPLDQLANTLELPVLRSYPVVARTRALLLAAGAPQARVSGSGPTLYAPFRTLAEAAALLARVRQEGMLARLCRSVSRLEVMHSRSLAPIAPPRAG